MVSMENYGEVNLFTALTSEEAADVDGGGLVGAIIGLIVGAIVCSPTGPGAAICAGAGAIAGFYIGEQMGGKLHS